MSTVSNAPFTPASFGPAEPVPFEDGDHMNVAEFLRRFHALPEELQEQYKHAELIEGVVRMPPTSGGVHAGPHSDFDVFIGWYRWATPGLVGGGAASIILDAALMPEPDLFLAVDPKFGGRIRLDDRGFVHGPPEWLGEISNTSVSYDLHTKKELYRKYDIKEYAVWRVKEKAIDWFILRGQDYEALRASDGIYRSEAFPGLWLAASSLVAGDFAKVRNVLNDGLNSPEHRAFVEQLAKNKSA
jgi:Uma2 family endonuclease